jgi:hypothetical protein
MQRRCGEATRLGGHLAAARLTIAALATVATIATFARSAAADDRAELVLDYRAPDTAGCPDEGSFRHLVAARLGYDPFVPVGPSVVHVSVTRDHHTLRGRIAIARPGQLPSTPRDLAGQSDQCAALGEALATTLAIALDPVHALATPAPAPSPAPPPPLAPPPLSPAPTAPLPPAPMATPPPAPLHVGLYGFAGGLASLGNAPAVTLGGDLGVGLRLRAFSLELSGRAETTPGDPRASSGDRLAVTILSGSLQPCLTLGPASGCVTGRLGALQGYAPDVTHPSLGSSLYAAVGVRVAYTFPLTSALALRPSLEAAIPLVRTQLEIDGTPIWTSLPLSGSANLALVVDFL